jgi:ribosomal protein S6--L-glutamate ligase
MNIVLLAESSTNPVLASVLARLGQRHTVTVRNPQDLVPSAFPATTSPEDHADMYLLKSRSPQAQAFARRAERAGALVVNRPAATAAALDRWAMATLLDLSGVPAPRTWSFPTLRQMAADDVTRQWLPWPLVVKSRTSGRGDLVRLVHDRTALLGLLPQWGDEPVIAQEFVANDGFDIKVWVIGDDLSAARRACALDVLDKTSDVALAGDDLPVDWVRTARSAGAALGLDLFGVDLLVTDRGPVVIDVNAFPGFQGANDPAESMLRFLERHASERLVHA